MGGWEDRGREGSWEGGFFDNERLKLKRTNNYVEMIWKKTGA